MCEVLENPADRIGGDAITRFYVLVMGENCKGLQL